MPDPSEESAVLNLDSGNTIVGIQQALKAYARTVPDAAVSMVTFEQQNTDGDRWKAAARLQCFGNLKPNEETKDKKFLLENVEPMLVHEEHWEAEGVGFAGAVEELRDKIDEYLQNMITKRQNDMFAANEALKILRNPNELDSMWALNDNPQDEHAAEQ